MGRKMYNHENYTVLLTNVPTNWPLSYISQALHRRFTSLIAIYRVCEYPEGRDIDRVFISVYNKNDYTTLKDFKSLIIRRREIPIIFNNWITVAAKFPLNFKSACPKEVEEVPVTLRIPGLQKLKCGISEYFNEVITALEEIGGSDLVGVSLVYGYNNEKLRSFGFASYKNQQAMLQQLHKCIYIKNDFLMCEEASSTPVVIPKSCGLIEHLPVIWTEELNRLNWLTIIPEVISSESEDELLLESDHEYDDNLNLVLKKPKVL